MLQRVTPEEAWSLSQAELAARSAVEEFQVQFYGLYEQQQRRLVLKRDSIEGELAMLEAMASTLQLYAQRSLLGRTRVDERVEAPPANTKGGASAAGPVRVRVRQVVATLDASELDAAYEAARQPKPFVDRRWWPQPPVPATPAAAEGYNPQQQQQQQQQQQEDVLEMVIHELHVESAAGALRGSSHEIPVRT